jgi:alpha-methylacyl-CoA racemase
MSSDPAGHEGRPGPLRGVKVVEFAAAGPVPFAAMLLADMGADVIRLARPSSPTDAFMPAGSLDVQHRGRSSVTLNLKDPEDVETALRFCDAADALIEGYRPGVMERLGLGPDVVLDRNPRIVYGRMTGYGQDGPMSAKAGHDINYIAISGALGAIARKGERPLFPMNLLGDYGGGGMLLAFGLLSGIIEARGSGEGQVVDASMVEGVALLTAALYGFRDAGIWNDEPGTNLLDSGAHFYEVYDTADGRFFAVGAGEKPFYDELIAGLGLDPDETPQWDRERWPELKERVAEVFRTRTRDEWSEVFDSHDACATPVLTLAEAHEHVHNRSRDVFTEVDGVIQPAPAPRFSRTPGEINTAARHFDTQAEALEAWGIAAPTSAR